MRPMPLLRRRRRAAALVAAAALALGAAACSDDEEPIDPEADEEVIEDAIVTLDDLPEGFEPNDPEEDDEDENDICFEDVGIDVDELDDAKVVEGDTADFQLISDEALVGVTAQITSFSDTGLAEESLEAATSDDFTDCVVEGVESSAEEDGQDVGEVDVDVIDSPVDGDAAASVRVRFIADLEGQQFPTTVEQHLLLVGRFGISLQVFSLGEDVDGDLAEELLETMVDRIEDATED